MIIKKLNESYLKIDCELDEARFISDYFTFTPKNYWFMKKNRPNWNGKIKLFNLTSCTLPIGCLDKLISLLKTNNYNFTLDESCKKYSIECSDELLRTFINDKLKIDINYLSEIGKLNLEQLEYQIDATIETFENNKLIILLPTGAGKSFAQFLVANYGLHKGLKKVLLIVPTVNLVNQMENDFLDYGKSIPDYHKYIHKIYSGQEKSANTPITISTWQSLSSIIKTNKEWLSQFEIILVDEVHSAETGKELSDIISSAKNAKIKLGMTGTLSGDKINKEQVESLFGEARRIKDRNSNKDIDTNLLIEKGILTDYEINMIVFKYPEDHVKEFKQELNKINKSFKDRFPDGVPKKDLQKAKYDYEMEWLKGNKLRTKKLLSFVKATKGNTLVLFKNVEYGEYLAELMDKYSGKNVYLVHGKVDKDEREKIRKIVNEEENCVICASTQIFALGINIPSLSYLIFAQGSKGRIKVLQAIGRLLRRFKGKSLSKFIDVVDDITGKNFSYNHALVRLDLYQKEKSKYTIKEINL